MKEIHAYENQDGTFAVTISNSSTKTKTNGKSEIRETTNSSIEISRAEVKILAYPAERSTGELLSVEVKE